MPNIGTALLSAGVIIAFQCIQTYVIDAYPRYAASAMSAVSVLRSFAGFGFPLFAPYMYAQLEYGWGNTMLGLVCALLGMPATIMFWFYGERIRRRSPFAAGDEPSH